MRRYFPNDHRKHGQANIEKVSVAQPSPALFGFPPVTICFEVKREPKSGTNPKEDEKAHCPAQGFLGDPILFGQFDSDGSLNPGHSLWRQPAAVQLRSGRIERLRKIILGLYPHLAQLFVSLFL
jgi:hypothetical protein